MRRPLAVLFSGAWLLLGSLVLSGAVTGATIAPTTTCSNGVDNSGGLGLICEVTVVNTITAGGGTATVTVRECHGAAGNPTAACTTTTSSIDSPVSVVNQCNDAINGGGGTLRCSVQVTNVFVGVSPVATGSSVNQCVGSGGGITVGCNPFPATASGPAITQCNGSANGGTLVGLTCTATGTMAAAIAITINQCNGSANGGGALVICSASLSSGVDVSPTPTPSPTPAPTPGATTTAPSALPSSTTPVSGPTIRPGVTVPPTDAGETATGDPGASAWLVAGGLLFVSWLSLVVRPARRAVRVR